MQHDTAHLTLVDHSEAPGLFLWSYDEGVIPSRLRGVFTKGRWVTAPLLRETSGTNGSRVAPVDVEGWWLEAWRAAQDLATIPLSEMRRFSHSASVWILASKWVIEAVARQQIVPSLAATDDPGRWRARWRVAPVRAVDRARLAGLADAMPGAARACSPNGTMRVLSPIAALHRFLDDAADGLMRASTEETTPITGRGGPDWVQRLGRALGGPVDRFEVQGLGDSYLLDALAHWTGPATEIGASGRPLVGFRLNEPHQAHGNWRIGYHLYTSGGADRVAVADLRAASGDAARVVASMNAPEETLIEALGRCARVFQPIERSLSEQLPDGVTVDAAEAWRFLTDASLKLERAGYFVDVPAALSRVGHRRVRARMRIGDERTGGSDGTSSGLLSRLVSFRWEACLGDDTLTANEFLELTRSKAPLVHHRGHWIAVDPHDVAHLQALMGGGAGELAAAEALRLALIGSVSIPDSGGLTADVVSDGDVASALARLEAGIEAGPRQLAQPDTLVASLRPYQERGLSWLAEVTNLGFGACLADDMGLGKTIQLLGLAAHIATSTPGARFMVVCPTSVIGNWSREIRRFFPTLRFVIHHGTSRAASLSELTRRMDSDDARAPTCLITSYALARRDRALLSAFTFDVLVLDEAQNIKNPDAAQSQAVRQLSARRRVALTGTPVENRLTELWSIVDFLNPGLLGTRHAFKKQFAAPIERYGDEDAADLLRRVTGPFILRRMKTDPAIAPELPDKVELVRYCPLTREQAALYQTTVDAALEDISGLAPGMRRRGRILSMITAIKQICNHPAQYLRDAGISARRSGKLTRFLELIDEVRDSDGHALVFTQYVDMGHILQDVLQQHLGERPPFLYGALSRQQRDEMVAEFQAPGGTMVMVISLRAGGTGLNLTRANHVFHYDRWWNPAVEDQATDRAFRIGQTRDVTVHRMVSQGTMEEQINQLLEDKRALAGRVVDTGETWLSELDDDTLRSLLTLGQDAVLED